MVHCCSACDIATTFDTMWAGMAMAAVSNNTSPRFWNHFRTELQIGDKRGASLIAGLEYGMERWNGKWNGTVRVHSYR